MGTILAIYISDSSDAPMREVKQAEAYAGKGIKGDRYFTGESKFFKGAPDQQITLIEEEALIALARDYDVELAPEASRRNLITRQVALNHLIDKVFCIGTVKLKGLRMCEPCSDLVKSSGKRVIPGLLHRGGLRAEILQSGVIRQGDQVEVIE